MTTENSSRHSKNYDIPDKQTALVLQGGGALGAYEVGVLKILCKKLLKSRKSDVENGPLFDIVAGSSIGAMNAAVLVSNVVNRHKTWDQAVELLEDFWMNEKNGLASAPDLSKWWWDDAKTQAAFSASPEAARRYYSVKEYIKHGTPNVCSGPKPEFDLKFADPDNTWFVHDIDPLQHTIERYSKDDDKEKLKIATSWSKREPRLLVISVDVAEGQTVTYDSYDKKCDSENAADKDDGITIDHVMASGTIPNFYKFREIDGQKFCDGGWLSNTPFRELLQAHRDYWTKVTGDNNAKIPDLDVYIVNVHPSKADSVPTDYYEVQNRANDIQFLDRNSHYDEKMTYLVTEYQELEDRSKAFDELIHDMKVLLTTHFNNSHEYTKFQNDLKHLLTTAEEKGKIKNCMREKYENLIKGKFRLTNVVRIERTNHIDSNTCSNADFSSKPIDFTHQTIKQLIEQGEVDAINVLGEC